MVRWRCCLILAMLLILPAKTGSKFDDDERDEDSRRSEDGEDDDEEDDDDDDDDQDEKSERGNVGRRAPGLATPKSLSLTRTTKRRPLECYVCAYKAETPLRSCLDPTKYRVHTITCHSADDKCFTSVISKGNSYEAVVRGCRSGCIGSPETTCCELSRCNNQAFATPVLTPHALASQTSKSNKSIPPTIFFFVTILLVLQTVVKVAI